MSRDIMKAEPLLQEFWPKLERWYAERYPGNMLILTHVDRTPEEQLRLFCQGRLPEFQGMIMTYKDGYVSKSKHNLIPSKAIDIAVRTPAGVRWDDVSYAFIPIAIKELGYYGNLKWGGDWTMKDYCHIEVI